MYHTKRSNIDNIIIRVYKCIASPFSFFLTLLYLDDFTIPICIGALRGVILLSQLVGMFGARVGLIMFDYFFSLDGYS